MKTKKKEVNLTKERDERIIPAVKELFNTLYIRQDLPFGSAESVTEEEVMDFYQARYADTIVPLLLKYDIRMNELEYFFQLVNQTSHFVKEITTSSIQMNRDICDAMLYGVNDINKLSLKELDAKIKEVSKEIVDKGKKDLQSSDEKI